MAATVCDDDPRSSKERRADALGALANGNHHLPVPASAGLPGEGRTAGAEVVGRHHVFTDQATVDAAQAAARSTAAAPAPSTPASAGTAILSGTEAIPTPLLAELLRNGAKLRPLRPPERSQSRAIGRRRNWRAMSGPGI